MKKILLVGNSKDGSCLEASYKRAFESIGFDVKLFDPNISIQKYLKLGKIGTIIHRFMPIEEWEKKMNREFIIDAKNYHPDLLFIACNAPITYNSLAFLKSILVKTKIILLWPDTIFNLKERICSSAPLYDGVVTYSSNSIAIFQLLGFKNVYWVPLAADETLHGIKEIQIKKDTSLCFIGGYRTERAEVLAKISKYFPALNIHIYGVFWDRCTISLLKPHIKNQAIRGKDFAKKLNQSLISLNVIDDTNFPAANMRFFETPIASGLQLSSACPEMEEIYLDFQTILYFRSDDELYSKIDAVLSNTLNHDKIRKDAYLLTKEHHTYTHRAQKIIDLFL